jgi:hypothetical protein
MPTPFEIKADFHQLTKNCAVTACAQPVHGQKIPGGKDATEKNDPLC